MLKASLEVEAITRQVIGAAIEVHRHLGPGFLESTYEEALAIELGLRRLSFHRQHEIDIAYKGHVISTSRLDLLVAGLVLNFNVAMMKNGMRRVIRDLVSENAFVSS
jgi:hypothetical protein